MKDLDPDGLIHMEPVFICFDGSPVPFFIESLTPRGGRKALVRLQGVRSGEDVGEIIGKDVYAEASSLPQGEEGEGGEFLIGWTLYDCSEAASEDPVVSSEPAPDEPSNCSETTFKVSVSGGSGNLSAETIANPAKRNGKSPAREVGPITDFIDIPNNPCIEVTTKNGAALIPLHEDLIVSINEESQSLVMSVPAGLI